VGNYGNSALNKGTKYLEQPYVCGNEHKGMWWESQLYAGQTLCTAADSLT